MWARAGRERPRGAYPPTPLPSQAPQRPNAPAIRARGMKTIMPRCCVGRKRNWPRVRAAAGDCEGAVPAPTRGPRHGPRCRMQGRWRSTEAGLAASSSCGTGSWRTRTSSSSKRWSGCARCTSSSGGRPSSPFSCAARTGTGPRSWLPPGRRSGRCAHPLPQTACNTVRDEIAQQLEEEARRCSERSGPVSRSSARVTRRLRSKARAEAEEEAERLGRRTDTGACSSGRGGGLGQCGAATRPCFSLTAAPRSLWRTAVAGRLMSDILTEEEVAEDLQAIHGDWVARSSTYCDSRACTPSQCTLWNALTLLSPPPWAQGTAATFSRKTAGSKSGSWASWSAPL